MTTRYSQAWLLEQCKEGVPLEYLFFWGHTKWQQQAVGTFLFSQWYPSPFTVEGRTYRTAEHWMMAEKARLFGDEEAVVRILRAETPKEAKELGRQVKGFDAETWEQHGYGMVVAGNRHKFEQTPLFKDYLLSTGNKIFVEASPVDPVWGIGHAQESAVAKNPFLWRGENKLGFALMEVRDQLLAVRAEQAGRRTL